MVIVKGLLLGCGGPGISLVMSDYIERTHTTFEWKDIKIYELSDPMVM